LDPIEPIFVEARRMAFIIFDTDFQPNWGREIIGPETEGATGSN